MQWSETALVLTTLVALLGAVWAIIRERRKPQLDEAQISAVKTEIKRTNEELNLGRDLRILDLERWGDQMRPWVSAVTRRDEQMLRLIQEDRERNGLPMPEIQPLPPPPEFPPPRKVRD